MNLPLPSKFMSIDKSMSINGLCDNLMLYDIGAIEGWIQIDKDVDKSKPFRILTISLGILTKDSKGDFSEDKEGPTEFYIEFSQNQLQWNIKNDIIKVDTPNWENGDPHHFCLNLGGSSSGFGLIIDGIEIDSNQTKGPNLKNRFINSVTIGKYKETPGLQGKIAALHFWKIHLTTNLITSLSDWNYSDDKGKGHFCPTLEFGFTAIPPSNLLGFLNPEINSFVFYREPVGYWVMDGSEPPIPRKADLTDFGIEANYHSIFIPVRYFLTAREKSTNKLYIISDTEENPILLKPDETANYAFISDDLMFTFKSEPINGSIDESLRFTSLKEKPIPKMFISEKGYQQLLKRPTILAENGGLHETLGSAFKQHTPPNLDKNLQGWNEVMMKDPFDSANETGAENYIFDYPDLESKRYANPQLTNGYAIPFGFKFLSKPVSKGSMHSSLITSGSELRKAATHTESQNVNANIGCAFVSADVSFDSNLELSKTEDTLYDNEVMYSQHTYLVILHSIVLDKSNVLLDKLNTKGKADGFTSDLIKYEKGDYPNGTELFSKYGTHYANALTYGARGRARLTYSKETMSDLLENCKKIGMGVQAKLSVTGEGITVGGGAGYSTSDGTTDSEKISKTQKADDCKFESIGGSGVSQDGTVHGVENNAIPILLDLRPITELLAPPFFDSYEITVELRKRLIEDLKAYLLPKKQPRSHDTFGFYSLVFEEGKEFWYDGDGPNESSSSWEYDYIYTSPGSLMITGLSNINNETTIVCDYSKLKNSIPHILTSMKNIDKIQFQFTPPGLKFSSIGEYKKDRMESNNDSPQNIKEILFDLELEGEDLLKGIRKEFRVVYKTWFSENNLTTDKIIIFAIKLKKLDIEDAFFNGLPEEWKGIGAYKKPS